MMHRYTTTLPVALDPGDPLLDYFATWAAIERDEERHARAMAAVYAQASHVRVAQPVNPNRGRTP